MIYQSLYKQLFNSVCDIVDDAVFDCYLFENKKIWNEETCYKEARKYHSRNEFQKGNGSAYEAARKNGWLDDYDWFNEKLKHNYWNEETCR